MAKYDYIVIELPQTDSRIGKESQYSGKIQFKTSFGILGKVKGEIQGGSLLVVHPDAQVKANLSAEYILVAGFVEGTIVASHGLYLYSGARLRGSVESRLIRMQPGVDFDGDCNLLKKESADIFTASRNEFRARLADKLSHRHEIFFNKS